MNTCIICENYNPIIGLKAIKVYTEELAETIEDYLN